MNNKWNMKKNMEKNTEEMNCEDIYFNISQRKRKKQTQMVK